MKVLSLYHKDVIVIELSHILLAVFQSVYWRNCILKAFQSVLFNIFINAASAVKIIEISGAFTEVM